MNLFIYLNLLIILPSALFWLLLSKINRKIWFNFKSNDRAWPLYVKSGIIGVPIHELSHALLHLIFGHNITGINLYNKDAYYYKDEHTLGYVDFSYNTGSLYQCFGLFFAGIAPLVVGSTIIVLLLALLMPGAFNVLITPTIEDVSAYSIVTNICNTIFFNVKTVFLNYDSIWKWFVFFILAFSISTQMHCSKQDIKNSRMGFILVETLIFTVDIFLYLYKVTINPVLIINVSIFILSIIVIEIVLSLIFLLISAVIKN